MLLLDEYDSGYQFERIQSNGKTWNKDHVHVSIRNSVKNNRASLSRNPRNTVLLMDKFGDFIL
jgi:hypothetical protein